MPRNRPALPDQLSLSSIGRRSWQVVGVTLAIAAVSWLVAELSIVIVAVILAVFITATMRPAFDVVARSGWGRTAAASVVTLGWVLGLVAMFALVGWRVVDQLPDLVDEVSVAFQRLRLEYPNLPLSQDRFFELLTDAQSRGPAGLYGSVRSVGETLSGVALAVVLSFFFLRDSGSMWVWWLSLFREGDQRSRMDAVGRSAFTTISDYIRGLSIVALADAVLSAVGLFALGIPLAAVLAVLTFIAAFIPVVGAFAVGAVAVALGFADGGVSSAALVFVLYVVIQQVDGSILQPYVMGQQLPLHPAVVLIALTLGGLQAGVVGALLAVPITAALVAAGHSYLTFNEVRHEIPPEPQ